MTSSRYDAIQRTCLLVAFLGAFAHRTQPTLGVLIAGAAGVVSLIVWLRYTR